MTCKRLARSWVLASLLRSMEEKPTVQEAQKMVALSWDLRAENEILHAYALLHLVELDKPSAHGLIMRALRSLPRKLSWDALDVYLALFEVMEYLDPTEDPMYLEVAEMAINRFSLVDEDPTHSKTLAVMMLLWTSFLGGRLLSGKMVEHEKHDSLAMIDRTMNKALHYLDQPCRGRRTCLDSLMQRVAMLRLAPLHLYTFQVQLLKVGLASI